MEMKTAKMETTAPDVIVRQVEGNEMHPEISAGDLVQIAPCERVRGGGGIYLIELDGVPVLQEVQRMPGRRLRLHSRRSSFKDCTIRRTNDGWVDEEGHAVEFEVVGRYVSVVQTAASTS